MFNPKDCWIVFMFLIFCRFIFFLSFAGVARTKIQKYIFLKSNIIIIIEMLQRIKKKNQMNALQFFIVFISTVKRTAYTYTLTIFGPLNQEKYIIYNTISWHMIQHISTNSNTWSMPYFACQTFILRYSVHWPQTIGVRRTKTKSIF